MAQIEHASLHVFRYVNFELLLKQSPTFLPSNYFTHFAMRILSHDRTYSFLSILVMSEFNHGALRDEEHLWVPNHAVARGYSIESKTTTKFRYFSLRSLSGPPYHYLPRFASQTLQRIHRIFAAILPASPTVHRLQVGALVNSHPQLERPPSHLTGLLTLGHVQNQSAYGTHSSEPYLDREMCSDDSA